MSNELSHTASAVRAELHAVFDDAREVFVEGLDVGDMNDWVCDTHRLLQRAEALYGEAVRVATTAQLSKRHGEPSLATHIAGQTHGNSRVVGQQNSFARWLHQFPQLADAFGRGDITRSHLQELRHVYRDHPKLHRHMTGAQSYFIDAAAGMQWPQWVDSIGYWVNSLDPDGELNDPADPKFGMTLRELPDGTVRVSGRLDPITGLAMLTAVEHEEQKLHRNELGDPNGPKLSTRQRTMCAFMKLIVRGFQREDGTFPVPLVQLSVSQRVAEDTLARVLGCINPDSDGPMDVNPYELPISYDDIDGRCETIRGTPIHPIHALIPLLIGTLRRVVYNDDGQPIELGTDARLFPPKLRAALLATFRGHCAVPGCNNPYPWLQADHIRPASLGGPTHLHNGQALCCPHNQAKGNHMAA